MKPAKKSYRTERDTGYRLPVYPYRTPPEIARQAKHTYPVIIAGAGLAGLTAALELGSRGVQTVLLDDSDTVGAAGLSSRCICYAKRSLEILDRFGVAERVRRKGVTWSEGDVFRGHERLYHFNLQPETDQKFPAFVNLQQFYVEEYLVDANMTVPAVDLRWKNKVVDVRPARDHVEVVVQTPDGPYRARCSYLLAADGSHSTVREKLGARDAVSAFSEDFWCISDVRMRRHESTVRKVFLDNPHNEGGAIWYHQMADNVWRTDWQVSHYPNPSAAATEKHLKKRLRGLLGAGAKFDVIWVGPWRFRRRCLERLVHGRVLFLGDAAAQHSPFGARGGNRAVQDANNLGWKLALILAGKAAPELLESYEAERHLAAREAVEIATRSATFIGPENEGQQVFRDATLELAQRQAWARELVNVGRLSTACTYVRSPLNREKEGERAAFHESVAMPGAAAPDGRIAGVGYLVERLQGQFTVAYFGREGPPLDVQTISIPLKGNEALCARYGATAQGATYVFRPDGHILARCRGIDPAFAREAIEAVSRFRAGAPRQPVDAPPTIHDRDRLYDEFASVLDGVPRKQREHALAQLAMALAYRLSPAEAAAAAKACRPRGGRRGPSRG